MNTADAIKHFGSAAKLAAALRLTRGAVSQWGERVPELRAYQLERLTGGALRVDDEPQRAPDTAA